MMATGDEIEVIMMVTRGVIEVLMMEDVDLSLKRLDTLTFQFERNG